MSKSISIGLVVAMMSGVWAADASAQRDAGAKARGDMRSFWDPGYRRSGGRTAFYQPAQPRTETYRRFSYEPVEINPGDTVVVDGKDANIMNGTDVVGAAPSGLKFKVTKTVDGWLGAIVDVDGQKLKGWIWHKSVELEEQASADSPQIARDRAQTESYRRFSYEPSRTGVSRLGILGRLFSGPYRN